PRATMDDTKRLCSLDSPCFEDSPGPYSLRPRVAVLGAAGAACACTESGLLPPRATMDDTKRLCSLDSPCFEDSPGPYSVREDGKLAPNTAMKCATDGICAPIKSENNYTADGTWEVLSATATTGTQYLRTMKTNCATEDPAVGAGCGKVGSVKAAVGFDPAQDLAVAGRHYTGSNARTDCATPDSQGSWGGKDSDLFNKPGSAIPNFCGRWKTRADCTFGAKAGTHYVNFKNGAFDCGKGKPTHGMAALFPCQSVNETGVQSCGSHKYKYYSNDEEDNGIKYSNAKAAESYFGNNEVCQFKGATEGSDAAVSPFLRAWAVGGRGLDASDSVLYPGDTTGVGSAAHMFGTVANPIPTEGGYADIPALTCGGGAACGDMWCGITQQVVPRNPVDPASTDGAATYTDDLGHGLVGFGHPATGWGDASTPPDRAPANATGAACGAAPYRYYSAPWMGNRGLNTTDGYTTGSVADDVDDDVQAALLSAARFDRARYYQRFPQLMRGALISATGWSNANGVDPDTAAPRDNEYIAALDGTTYCADGDCTADQDFTAALTPVTRCVLDLDRMTGLGAYDPATGVWTPDATTSYADRVAALQGNTRVTGGPEALALSEQDWLQLWHTMRLDISLGGTDGEATACQPLSDICQYAAPDAWDTTPAGCEQLQGSQWYDAYDGTLGPLVNMCSFAAPQYTDLMTLRANFKTFAAAFHPAMKNVVRGVGAVELDQPVLDGFRDEVATIQSYRMNSICANALASDDGNKAHLGCSLPLVARGTTSATAREVRSIGDLARWYWTTLPDAMKEDLLAGVCTYDPTTGDTVELSCNADGTTAAATHQNAYLPECASMNRRGSSSYCTLKELTSLQFVDDACWYNPSIVTSKDQYFCLPSSTWEQLSAWKTPATVSPACVNETVCIQEINLVDVTAGGNVNLDDINMNQCCVTNVNGDSAGDCDSGSVTLCPVYDTPADDPQGVCGGGAANASSCTACVDPAAILSSSDADVVASCGAYTSALFPTSTKSDATDCQALYAAGGFDADQQRDLACKVCSALSDSGVVIADCSGVADLCA
ncbi:MAG: hypothetical protein AAFS07_18960, partial [Pseudomonadota bacterium]